MIASEKFNSSTGIPAEGVSTYPSVLIGHHSGIADEELARDVFQVWRSFNREIDRIPKETEIHPFGRMNVLDNQFILNESGVSNILGPLQLPISQKPYRITEIAHDFIRKQKRSMDLNKSLHNVSNRILEFMKEQDIKLEIIIDLEVDTEYDDWIEPRIKVLVEPSKLEQAYSFFDKLLDFSLKNIPKKEVKRFRITLDMM